ncbi:MAG: hypothetical protein H0W64_05110 [Gammaproteobacteria bacterium]|nr:hypothetical protein [Gammaproteobacteria bacterium]
MQARQYTIEELYNEVKKLGELLATTYRFDKSERQQDFELLHGKRLNQATLNFYSENDQPKNLDKIDECFAQSKARKITEAIMNIAYHAYFSIDEHRAQMLLTMALNSPLADKKFDHIPHGHKHNGFYHKNYLHSATCGDKFYALKFNFDAFKKYEQDGDALQEHQQFMRQFR